MAEIDKTISGFIARWQGVTGHERANYQLFLTELTSVLDLPGPDPAAADHKTNAYCFERKVTLRHGDGSESYGFIDLYRRGALHPRSPRTSRRPSAAATTAPCCAPAPRRRATRARCRRRRAAHRSSWWSISATRSSSTASSAALAPPTRRSPTQGRTPYRSTLWRGPRCASACAKSGRKVLPIGRWSTRREACVGGRSQSQPRSFGSSFRLLLFAQPTLRSAEPLNTERRDRCCARVQNTRKCYSPKPIERYEYQTSRSLGPPSKARSRTSGADRWSREWSSRRTFGGMEF